MPDCLVLIFHLKKTFKKMDASQIKPEINSTFFLNLSSNIYQGSYWQTKIIDFAKIISLPDNHMPSAVL